MRETILKVCGADVRAMLGGEGEAVLYLHGLEGPRADPLLTGLAKTHRVIAPEIPGFGRSQAPEWMMGMADLALFGLDLAESLNQKRLHLVGYAIGGWMAAEMAIASPSAFASLSLIAPMGVLPKQPAFDLFAVQPEEVLRAQFHDASLAEAELAARANEDIDITLQNRTGLARVGWTPRLGSVQLPHWLHRVRAPTAIFWGREDKIVPIECAEVFAREIAGARLTAYERCGHAATIERGAETAQAIAKHIAGAAA